MAFFLWQNNLPQYFCHMSSILLFRQQLQISQNDFAVYLGVTRTHLSMVEIGERDLPTEALIKLTRLTTLFTKTAEQKSLPLIATEMAEEKNTLKEYLQQRAAENLYRVKHLQKKLEAMQLNYKNALVALHSIRKIKNGLADIKENKKDLLWIAAIEPVLQQKIKLNGLVEQKNLEIKIMQLQAAIT